MIYVSSVATNPMSQSRAYAAAPPNMTGPSMRPVQFGDATEENKLVKFFKNGFTWMSAVELTAMILRFVLDQSENKQFMKGFYEVLPPRKLQKISFDQVIGHDRVKQEMQAFIQREQFPNVYKELYKDDPRGLNNYLLLTGPPGTGKTMLAKAVASNLEDTAFVSVHCDNLVQLKPGTGPKNIANLEKKIDGLSAKRVILFMDEIDSLGSRLASTMENPDDYKTLTRLLKMLDGIKEFKGKELFVIGATNKPEVLDDALRSRFRQIVEVPPPNNQELEQLYQLYLDQKGLKLEGPLDMSAIVEASQGFTGRKVEQTVSILKTHCIQTFATENMAQLEEQLRQSKKKKTPPPKIELTYTQADLLNAIQAAKDVIEEQKPVKQSSLDLAA